MNKSLFWTGTGMQIVQLLFVALVALIILPINWSLMAKGFALSTSALVILGYNVISWIMIHKGIKGKSNFHKTIRRSR